MRIAQRSVPHKQARRYLPRGKSTLHTIFERYFADFFSRYNEKYAGTYGKFLLERIEAVGEHFLTCGGGLFAGAEHALQSCRVPDRLGGSMFGLSGKYNRFGFIPKNRDSNA